MACGVDCVLQHDGPGLGVAADYQQTPGIKDDSPPPPPPPPTYSHRSTHCLVLSPPPPPCVGPCGPCSSQCVVNAHLANGTTSVPGICDMLIRAHQPKVTPVRLTLLRPSAVSLPLAVLQQTVSSSPPLRSTSGCPQPSTAPWITKLCDIQACSGVALCTAAHTIITVQHG